MTQHIPAPSARAALAQLEGQGYTEITLHTDDATAILQRLFDLASDGKEFVTPSDDLNLRTATKTGYILSRLERFKLKSWKTSLLAGVTVGILTGTGLHTTVVGFTITAIASVVIFLPLVIAIWTLVTTPRRYYALVEAGCWGRWQEVIDSTPRLRGRISGFDLDMRLATAHAAMGRFDEGLAICEQHMNNPEVPRWMYLIRVSEVYGIVHRYDEVIDCHRQAYEEAPENPSVVLAYAETLLAQNRELDLALKLIAHGETLPLSDTLEMLLPFHNGLAALNGNHDAKALDLLRAADANLAPLAPTSAPVRKGLDLIQAYKGIALAKLGDTTEARQCFDAARPRLEALNDTQLVKRIEEALAT